MPKRPKQNGDARDGPRNSDDDGEEQDVDVNGIHSLGERQDPRVRREIRLAYTSLRIDTQANREELIRPGSDGLQQCLMNANQLYGNVKEPREAAMDAGLVALVSNLGKQLAQNLHTDFSEFEPMEYAEKLITAIGGHQLPEPDRERAPISKDGWVTLGKAAQPFFKCSPPLHCMLGTFDRGPPVVKQRQVHKQAPQQKETEGPTAPKELASFKDTKQEEVTTQEVERMLGVLQQQYDAVNEKPICFFEFVINPDSFGLSVENLFYASFLIRDGLARIFLDEDRLPVIEPVKNATTEEVDTIRVSKTQVVMTMTMQEWKEIVDTFHIKRPLIRPRESVHEPSTSGPAPKKGKRR